MVESKVRRQPVCFGIDVTRRVFDNEKYLVSRHHVDFSRWTKAGHDRAICAKSALRKYFHGLRGLFLLNLISVPIVRPYTRPYFFELLFRVALKPSSRQRIKMQVKIR